MKVIRPKHRKLGVNIKKKAFFFKKKKGGGGRSYSNYRQVKTKTKFFKKPKEKKQST